MIGCSGNESGREKRNGSDKSKQTAVSRCCIHDFTHLVRFLLIFRLLFSSSTSRTPRADNARANSLFLLIVVTRVMWKCGVNMKPSCFVLFPRASGFLLFFSECRLPLPTGMEGYYLSRMRRTYVASWPLCVVFAVCPRSPTWPDTGDARRHSSRPTAGDVGLVCQGL